MVAANGVSYSPLPNRPRDPAVPSKTREFLARYGLDANSVFIYPVNDFDRPVDLVRLTNDQLGRIPAEERPAVFPEVNGKDNLLYLAADGADLNSTAE